MKRAKRILVTMVLAAVLAAIPKTNAEAASTASQLSPMQVKPLDENPLRDNPYAKNIEAVFSDGTKGQFIDIKGTDIIWSTRTTPVGNTNHDIVRLQYRVQKGDCLWNISMALGISLDDLLELNANIQNPDLIYVGDVIVLMIPK